MLKELLQIKLDSNHDKQAYRLKRNEIVFRQSNRSLKFDAICYDFDDIEAKVLLEATVGSSNLFKGEQKEPFNMAVIFNYNLPTGDLKHFVKSLLGLKLFSDASFTFAHFQIRNGHISDYNKCIESDQKLDDLEQFEREIDNCLKLDRLWKINQFVKFRHLNENYFEKQVVSSSRKFGKRNNEFFIIDIEGKARINIIVLPRSRQFVLSREEEKEIEELFVLKKHLAANRSITFETPLAKVISNYIDHSNVNLFVSCFPQQDKSIAEIFRLPLRMGNSQEEEIKKILAGYNKDKSAQLQQQAEKMRKKLKQLHFFVKSELQNMAKLAKIYTLTKTFPCIDYLDKRNITNINNYSVWIDKQIKEKESAIEEEETGLKQIHKEMISDQERHLFYLNKIKQFKLKYTHTQTCVTPLSVNNHQSVSELDEDLEVSEQEMMYFYDPKKQLARYKEKKEENLKTRINQSQYKIQFMKLIEEAKKKLSKIEFVKIEQKFYDLLR